jgi:DNA-binding transcriptional ArsR family regulator
MTTVLNRSKAVDSALKKIDSDFVKALAEPARIEIIKQLIILGPSDVKTLAEQMPQDRSVISRHLALMEKAGLLKASKEGRHVIYTVDAAGSLQKSEQLVSSIRQCLTMGCC